MNPIVIGVIGGLLLYLLLVGYEFKDYILHAIFRADYSDLPEWLQSKEYKIEEENARKKAEEDTLRRQRISMKRPPR